MDNTIHQKFAEPFDPTEVKWKPGAVSGNRALAMCYVDARLIMDRLDEVLGVEGWQDEYEVLPEGSVVCKLRCRIGEEWITKTDVGSPSEQPDDGDKMKAAFSDALKRVAVKYGIGRYLYRLPAQWVDYDPQKRKFTSTPKLPAIALPSHSEKDKPAPAKPSNGSQVKSKMPKDGATLYAMIREREAGMVEKGMAHLGHLVDHVQDTIISEGGPTKFDDYSAANIARAVELARAWVKEKEEHKAAFDANKERVKT